jgi:monofunctional biosynthetic peptidoglycan transglycosylase
MFLSLNCLGDITMAQDLHTVIDFGSQQQKFRWRVVNDGVMGGLSQSQLTISTDGFAVFQGTVSLENNGGFASVRTEPTEFGLAGKKGLLLRLKGDGRIYQLRLRTDQRWDGIAYKANFSTQVGLRTTARLDFESFLATFRGRQVPGAPALEPGRIQQIGFLISDKQEGPFRLEIESIEAY